MKRKREPIALTAYEKVAARFADLIDEKAVNAFFEMPATLSVFPHVGGKRVLDAGCGPGRYAEWLISHGAEVVGIDVSPKLLRRARKRLGGRAELHVADLNGPLDFLEGGSFDMVLATLILDYIEDWRPLFREFNRVLKGFGLLIFSCRHPFGHFDLHPGGDYFRTEYVEDMWKGFGTPVVVPCYRRPLRQILSATADTGFAVEELLEPRPDEEVRKRDPDAYDRLARLPGLICVRARKKTG